MGIKGDLSHGVSEEVLDLPSSLHCYLKGKKKETKKQEKYQQLKFELSETLQRSQTVSLQTLKTMSSSLEEEMWLFVCLLS